MSTCTNNLLSCLGIAIVRVYVNRSEVYLLFSFYLYSILTLSTFYSHSIHILTNRARIQIDPCVIHINLFSYAYSDPISYA